MLSSRLPLLSKRIFFQANHPKSQINVLRIWDLNLSLQQARVGHAYCPRRPFSWYPVTFADHCYCECICFLPHEPFGEGGTLLSFSGTTFSQPSLAIAFGFVGHDFPSLRQAFLSVVVDLPTTVFLV